MSRMEPRALAAFSARLDEGAREKVDPADLEKMWQVARAAWPAIPLDAERFCAFLGERTARLGCLPTSHAADLYLVCACIDGDQDALRAFDSLLGEVGRKLRHNDNRQNLEEALQKVRQVVLARDDRPAPLDDYLGSGALGGWLRIALTRALIDLARSAPRETRADTGELAAAVDEHDDPETRYLKTHYQAEFKAAFAVALAGLSPDDRRALRYSIVERLSIDEIAQLDNVHRATAARQVARARERLAEETRKVMRERLRIDLSQLESVLRLIDGQVDVSVRRLLAT
jgi:RNA polymerase sigma-70 factor, ECF subfamily